MGQGDIFGYCSPRLAALRRVSVFCGVDMALVDCSGEGWVIERWWAEKGSRIALRPGGRRGFNMR